MNISRRSLVFSLIFHASLVFAGTIWLLLPSPGQGGRTTAESRQMFQVTPVVLATPTLEPKPKLAEAPKAKPPISRRPRLPSPPSRQPEPSQGQPAEPSSVPSQPHPPVIVKRPSLPDPTKSYPTAVKPSPASGAVRQKSPSSQAGRRERSRPAPLWSPEETPAPGPEVAVTPTPGPAESPGVKGPTGNVGEPEGSGRTSEPTPIGIIDPGAEVESFKQLTSGYVEVEFEIQADGQVASVTLLQGTGIASVDADLLVYFKTFRWNPKLLGGVAVDARQSMDFQLEARRN